MLLVFSLAFLSSGWFTYKIASASDKIFTENTTGGSPILKNKKKLKDQDGRINILLIGVGGESHDGGTLADTIQLVSISPSDKSVAMVSIPRDLYVRVPDSYEKVKINEVHALGEDNTATEGGGPGLLKEAVSEVTGQPVHYFVRADFDGFRKVVDSVGGVDVKVPPPGLYDPYYPRGHGYQILNVRPGEQRMDGELALKYARSRETTSDFDRSRRQQEVLVAARDKALSTQYLTNPAKIGEMIDILGNHIKTDLSLGEAERLAEIVREISPDKIQSKVIDGMDSGLLYDSIGPGGAYILLPRDADYSEIHEFVAQLFSSSKIREQQPRLEIQNASGQSGLAAAEAELLAGFGYVLGQSGTAPAIAERTVLYDYTDNQKQESAKFLADRYGAEIVRQPGARADTDLLLVVGTDYAAKSPVKAAR